MFFRFEKAQTRISQKEQRQRKNDHATTCRKNRAETVLINKSESRNEPVVQKQRKTLFQEFERVERQAADVSYQIAQQCVDNAKYDKQHKKSNNIAKLVADADHFRFQ